MASAFDGRSAMDGQSQMRGNNPYFSFRGTMMDIGKKAFSLTFPGLIKDLYSIYKVHAKSQKELEDFETACDHAIKLAEADRQKEALSYMEETLNGLETAGALDEVKKQFRDRIQKAYEDMLAIDDPDKANSVSQESFKNFCAEMGEAAGDDAEMKAAWDTISKIVDNAYEKAGEEKKQMALSVIECENQDLEFVAKNLNKVRIPTQIFYKEPSWDDHTKGFLVTPMLTKEAEDRVHGAVALAQFKHMASMITTKEQYDRMIRMAPVMFGGNRYNESLCLSGLTRAEAEFMRQRLMDEHSHSHTFAAVVESSAFDGTFVVLYPKESSNIVHQEYVSCLLQEKGYGTKSNFEDRMNAAADERDRVPALITMLARGREDEFIVVDSSGVIGGREDKAKIPDHFLRVEKGRIREYRAVQNKDTGEWSAKLVENIDLRNRMRGTTPEELIENKILQFAQNSVMIRGSQGEKFGITKDDYQPTEKLKTFVRKKGDPGWVNTQKGLQMSKEERQNLKDNIMAQKKFAEYVARQAAFECKDAPSVEAIVQYVSLHSKELLERYYHYEAGRIEKNKENGKDVSRDLENLEKNCKLLRDDNSELGFENVARDAADDVFTRTITQLYTEDIFTSAAIDSIAIDEKEILDVQRAVLRAQAMAETPLAKTSFQAAVMHTVKANLDDRVKNTKMTIRMKYPGISDTKCDKMAAASEFANNIHEAVFGSADFAEDSEAAARYKFDFNQAAENLVNFLDDKYSCTIEDIADVAADNDRAKLLTKEERTNIENAKNAIDPFIRNEVIRQMNGEKTKDEHENER